MARKSLFESGPHASRTGYRGEITEADWRALRLAAPSCVPDEALAGLAHKIIFAEADAARANAHVPTRDQLTQLRKLKRIAKRGGGTVIDADGHEHPFAELADALANLDQGTFELIQDAERAAIQAIVDRDGVFIDVDRNEHRAHFPRIQSVKPLVRKLSIAGVGEEFADFLTEAEMVKERRARGEPEPAEAEVAEAEKIRLDMIERLPAIRKACTGGGQSRTPASVWFPRGIEGFIESVAQVIAGLEMVVDDAGRRDKPWQAELAKTVVQFWRLHCTYESQSAHRDRLIADQGSPLVEFGQTVFAVAGSRLSVSRISHLLNTCK